MAVIQRPGKEGNATTYQGKVAAGYTNILAQEVDADIDAIYSAWNSGVDTVNIKPGSVTAACLAPGAVTGNALAPGSITNAALAANSVNSTNIVNGTIVGNDIAPGTLSDSLISNVAWTKLIAPLIYALPCTPRGAVVAGATYVDIHANTPSEDSYDGTKPSYILRLDYGADQLTLYRAPPPGTAFVVCWAVTGADKLMYANYPAGFLNRSLLGVNAPNGAPAFVPNPSSFQVTTTGWKTVATLPALTTRGGLVHLWSAAGLSVLGPGTSGGNCYAQWLCDGVSVVQDVHLLTTAAPLYVPIPNLCWLHSPAAGTHTYAYQVAVDTNMQILGTNQTTGGFLALEVG